MANITRSPGSGRIFIPPEALEAGTDIIRDYRKAGVKSDKIARAAFLAMLQAWPNRVTVKDDGRRQTYIIPAIILPLPSALKDKP